MRFKEENKRPWTSGIGILEDQIAENHKTGDKESSRERRVAERTVLSVPVKYRLSKKNPFWKKAQGRNISANGICLVLNRKVNIGTEIELHLKLPGSKEVLSLTGRVVWSRPSLNAPLIECGVAFETKERQARRNRLKERMYEFFADKMCGVLMNGTDESICRPAETPEALKAAFRLAYEAFLARGYCKPNSSGMHYHHFALLPESRTFILTKKDELLGTIGLVPDSPCGVPMESSFPGEIAALRRSGKRIAEVTLLALKLEAFKQKAFVLTNLPKFTAAFQLFSEMFAYARGNGIDSLVITVNQKHEDLYRYLTFEPIGAVRNYPGVCPTALPMAINFDHSFEVTPDHRLIKKFFGSLENVTCPSPWKTEMVRELLMDTEPALWPQVPEKAQAYFKVSYPGLVSKDPREIMSSGV